MLCVPYTLWSSSCQWFSSVQGSGARSAPPAYARCSPHRGPPGNSSPPIPRRSDELWSGLRCRCLQLHTHGAKAEHRFRTRVWLSSKLKKKPNGDLPLLATSHAISKRTASSKSNSSSQSSRPERDVTDRLRASGMLGKNKTHCA